MGVHSRVREAGYGVLRNIAGALALGCIGAGLFGAAAIGQDNASGDGQGDAVRCFLEGEVFPAGGPIDYGREPKIRLAGIGAQSLIAKLGVAPEGVEETGNVVIYFVAPPTADIAALDFRVIIAFDKVGCYLGASTPIPYKVLDRLIPGA